MAFPWAEIESIGSLLGGLGTTAAFGATIWLIRREQNDRRERRLDEERRLARLVTAELGPQAGSRDRAGPDGEIFIAVDVHNHGPEPISEVTVFVPDILVPVSIGTVKPGNTGSNSRYTSDPEWFLQHVGPGCQGTEMGLDLEVVFRDNRGLRWRRTGQSEPVRIPPTLDVREDWRKRALTKQKERAAEFAASMRVSF